MKASATNEKPPAILQGLKPIPSHGLYVRAETLTPLGEILGT
jgi:hypothetical protein